MNLLTCPHCGTPLEISLTASGRHPSDRPRRGRPPKPKPAASKAAEENTISVAHWLSLGGPAGFNRFSELPGSEYRSADVWARYHHWATRFSRPLMMPSVFGRAVLRLGVTGRRNKSFRFLVFPSPLYLAPWLARPCPVQTQITPLRSFDPERLPWVEGLRMLAAAEPDNPRWPALLEALPGHNWTDPLDPMPAWVVPYDASLSEPMWVPGAGGGVPAGDGRSVEGSPITRVEPPLS